MINRKDVGKRIKERREEQGYTQEKLAEKCGRIRQTISKWENGAINLTIEEFIRLCNILDCDIGYLLGEYGTKRHKDANIQEETGLSENAIKRLKYIKKHDPLGLGSSIYLLELISFVIEDENFWEQYKHLSLQYFSLLDKYIAPNKKNSVELTESETIRYSIMRVFENLLDSDYNRFKKTRKKGEKNG